MPRKDECVRIRVSWRNGHYYDTFRLRGAIKRKVSEAIAYLEGGRLPRGCSLGQPIRLGDRPVRRNSARRLIAGQILHVTMGYGRWRAIYKKSERSRAA